MRYLEPKHDQLENINKLLESEDILDICKGIVFSCMYGDDYRKAIEVCEDFFCNFNRVC